MNINLVYLFLGEKDYKLFDYISNTVELTYQRETPMYYVDMIPSTFWNQGSIHKIGS